MHTDPIADMLTRIRNAQMAKKTEIVLPYSKIKFNIAKILAREGWVGKVEVLEPQLFKNTKACTSLGPEPSANLSLRAEGRPRGDESLLASRSKEKNAKFNQLKIRLLYKGQKPKITQIKRISKPGRRIYVSKDKLPVVLNNYGIAIISTSKGLMINKEAKKEGMGGEVVCEVY